MLWSRGLQGLWRFENTALDGSGGGNHGTLVGTCAYASGILGRGVDIPAYDDYVHLPRPPLIASSSAITVAVRAKLNVTADLCTIFEIGDGNATLLIACYFSGGNGMLVRNGTSAAQCTNLSFNPGLNNWHSWIFARADASSCAKIYCDNVDLSAYEPGVLEGWHTDGIEFAPGDSKITVDEVAIWNRVLAEADRRRVTMGMAPIG